MSIRSYVIQLMCVALLGGVGFGAIKYKNLSNSSKAKAEYTIPRQIRYGFTISNKTNRTVKQAEFWVYGPVYQTATQKSVSLTASQPFELVKDKLGNQVLHFSLQGVPPLSRKVITVQADLLLSDKPQYMPQEHLDLFLQPQRYIETENPFIVEQAGQVKQGSDAATATAIYDWVVGHIQYAGYIRQERGALYALKNRKGDCTEFAYLFTALAIAADIPARAMGGYFSESDTVLRSEDYHNWAEFYQDQRWQLADPQKRVLRKEPWKYIAMKVKGGAEDNPLA